MNKQELIAQVAARAKLTRDEATAAVNTALDALAGKLAEGESVTLTGFGSFAISEHQAHNGRNPQTGETMVIPARRRIKFTAGKKLKEAVA